jgi:hypothetical protein
MPGNSRHDLPILKRYIKEPSGCWLWVGNIGHDGYGRCKWQNQTVGAHRVFYERFHGPSPAGKEVHHKCRNRACVNPAHLSAVTRAENTQDGGSAKLRPDDVREIRRVMDELCERYGVSPGALREVALRRTWKDVV